VTHIAGWLAIVHDRSSNLRHTTDRSEGDSGMSSTIAGPAPCLGPVTEADTAVIITSDAHVGPTFAQMREYCPAEYRDDFDAFAAQISEGRRFKLADGERLEESWLRNWLTEGSRDVDARLADMNRDGVVAEVVFHGLTASEEVPTSLPFHIGMFGHHGGKADNERLAIGRRIYDEWLADFCSVEPERHAGLVQLPLWDIPSAITELRWARGAGLRGVNFPRPSGSLPRFNDPVWDPFWAACVELDMPLVTHAQAVGEIQPQLPGDQFIGMLELSGYDARWSMRQMVFGGVFERFPALKLVFTEQTGLWWHAEMLEMDGMYIAQGANGAVTKHLITPRTDVLKMLPSEYCHRNIFIGATCIAPFEVADALEHDYDSQVMWGSDYPHLEGCSQYPLPGETEPFMHTVLRDSFAGVPVERTAAMLGGNAARVFGPDIGALRDVAERIQAPTYGHVATPLDFDPTNDPAQSGAPFCFRRTSGWN
jgi:predicted TIM-barrel fold metal-dependent hydrolase